MEMQQETPVINENAVGPFEGTPKTMFFMGLFAGIAICTTAMLLFFVWSVSNGQGIFGGGKVAGVAQEVQPTVEQPTQAGEQPTVAAGPVKAVDEKADHIKGAKNAKVTLIEYSDFECPFCKRHFETMNQILKDYPNDVRLVFRHFPLTNLHQNAQKEAEASECAAELGGNDAFWKMHDKIFTETQSNDGLSLARLPAMAKEIGLDEAKFKTCLDTGKYTAKVQKDQQDGGSAGVEGTPATFVNGVMISGAQPLANFKAAIDAELKK